MLAGGNSDVQGIINNTSTGNLFALSCHTEVYQFPKLFSFSLLPFISLLPLTMTFIFLGMQVRTVSFAWR